MPSPTAPPDLLTNVAWATEGIPNDPRGMREVRGTSRNDRQIVAIGRASVGSIREEGGFEREMARVAQGVLDAQEGKANLATAQSRIVDGGVGTRTSMVAETGNADPQVAAAAAAHVAGVQADVEMARAIVDGTRPPA